MLILLWASCISKIPLATRWEGPDSAVVRRIFAARPSILGVVAFDEPGRVAGEMLASGDAVIPKTRLPGVRTEGSPSALGVGPEPLGDSGDDDPLLMEPFRSEMFLVAAPTGLFRKFSRL